jgi:NhaA family Na+:H+ antiporter
VHVWGGHATIAGVALGLLVSLDARGADAPSPLERLEETLHPWTSYAIVPIFALANAGVALDAGALGDAARSPVSTGVALGLIAGKPIGIVVFAWLAVRLGIAVLPDGVAWRHIAAVAVVAGIGFTVSLFIAELAYADAGVVAEA